MCVASGETFRCMLTAVWLSVKQELAVQLTRKYKNIVIEL